MSLTVNSAVAAGMKSAAPLTDDEVAGDWKPAGGSCSAASDGSHHSHHSHHGHHGHRRLQIDTQ